MEQTTHPTTTTRGNGAARVLVSATLAALALAAAVTVWPVPLGGLALVAITLGVLGIIAGTVVEGVAR